ncbi:MAG: DNA repair and recombination protein RadB [Candidatus Pacearchaeota archaeon]
MESKISAGSYDLNKFLYGGYERDIINTVYGPGGSGKSNFCMCACVSQSKKNNKVLFIDTEASFSIDRYKQIHSGTREEVEKDLQNVFIFKPTNFLEQEKIFEDLNNKIKNTDFSLIIVDSIGMLYRVELASAIQTKKTEEIQKVNQKLAKQLMLLNEIARKKNICVLVTNQVYSNFVQDIDKIEKSVNMVGGDLLNYWSKCLIELQINFGKRKMILKKHRSIREKEMFFEINNLGIKRKSSLF